MSGQERPPEAATEKAGKSLRSRGHLYFWYRLADRLGFPVRQAKRKVSAREFQGWVEWFKAQDEEKWQLRDRADYYSAQTAYRVYLLEHAVRHLLSSKAAPDPEHQLSDFLLNFSTTSKKQEEKAEEPALEDAALLSKNRWFAMLGMTLPKEARGHELAGSGPEGGG